jgi:excisionase family DNA binding protein
LSEVEDSLLTVAEVAALFRVSKKTVTRWVIAGRLSCVRTPGGYPRFAESFIRQALSDQTDLIHPMADRTRPVAP